MAQEGTGYEGPDDSEDEGVVTFELEQTRYLYTGMGTSATLKRNDSNIGLIYLKSQQEFDWLKTRIDGAFDPEIYQVKIKGELP